MFKIQNSIKETLDYKFFIFPAGEVGIKLNCPNFRFFTNLPKNLEVTFDQPHIKTHTYKVTARLHNSDDIISLAMIKNAIENEDMEAKIDLFMPYVPYARQDRICDTGEAFSLKVFTTLLNSLNFNSVTICDPHSEVTPALIDRVRVIDQLDIIRGFEAFRKRIIFGNCVFISPDAGSNKKTSKLAAFFNHTNFIRADKLRNLATGQIKETIVYCDDFEGTDVVIADDLCDGGMTFIKLAEVLKKKNCGKVLLYVTHGVFSKGFAPLLDGGIDEIYTTDSFSKNLDDLCQKILPATVNIYNL
jgi:ribose-phosphate pyrophosphokinase